MRTLKEKIAIVEEATLRGASITFVARKHGMNPNLVFGGYVYIGADYCRQRHGKYAPLLAR